MVTLFFLCADSTFAFHASRNSLSTFSETSRWMSLPKLASIVMRRLLSVDSGMRAYDTAIPLSLLVKIAICILISPLASPGPSALRHRPQ